MSSTNLAQLICGDYKQHSSVEQLLQVLFHNICTSESKLGKLSEFQDSDITLLGPYYARNLLEATCTTLIGRFDPFRLIYIYKVQSQDSYLLGKKANAAIKWHGDVFEKGGSRQENLWDIEKEFSKVSRSLLGDCYGEVYWNSGYELLIDNEDYFGEASLEYLRTTIEDPRKFINYLRQKASTLYSSLSKGIHSELIVRQEIIFDKTTVLELVTDVIKLCSIMGIVSHYSYFGLCKIPINNAFTIYKELYEWSEKINE